MEHRCTACNHKKRFTGWLQKKGKVNWSEHDTPISELKSVIDVYYQHIEGNPVSLEELITYVYICLNINLKFADIV